MARRSHDFAGVRDAFRPGLLATGCATSWTAAQLVLRATGVPPIGGTAAVAAGAACDVDGPSSTPSRRSRRLIERVMVVKEPGHAEELAVRCEALLAAGELPPERVAVIEINLATALIALSARSDQGDQLERAFALDPDAPPRRRRSWRSAPPSAWSTACAPRRRGPATTPAGTTRSGCSPTRRAQNAERRPEAPGLAIAARAARSEWRAQFARSEQERLTLLEQAIAELDEAVDRHAVAARPARAARRALARSRPTIPVAGTSTRDPAARPRARRLVNADARDRDTVRLALADLLMRRADAETGQRTGPGAARRTPLAPPACAVGRMVDRGDNDLIRAFRLYMSVAFSDGRSEEARRRLPAARERMTAVAVPVQAAEWSDRQTGWMYGHTAEGRQAWRPTARPRQRCGGRLGRGPWRRRPGGPRRPGHAG